jgi:hypothetical protein
MQVKKKKAQTKPKHVPFMANTAAKFYGRDKPRQAHHTGAKKAKPRHDSISSPGALTPRLRHEHLQNAIGFTARHLCDPHEYWEV